LVPAQIILVPNQPFLGQRETLQLTATVVDATGHAMPGEKVTFSSAAPAIVSVSQTGLLTSQGPLGDAVITADDHGLTATVSAQVVQRIASIAVTPNSLDLHRNTTRQLTATATDVLGDPILNPVFVFVSNKLTVARVDQLGMVTAQNTTGSAKITVSLDTFAVNVPVTVYARPTSLSISPSPVIVPPGGTKQLAAQVLDSLGSPIAGSPLTYTNHSPALISISGSGLITSIAGTGAGSVTVQSGALSQTVTVLVASGMSGVITATTQIGGPGYGVAIGPAGEVFAGLLYARTVVHGVLPSQSLGDPLVVGDLPLGMAINPAGTRTYVALGGVTQVAVIDIPSDKVLPSITGFGSNVFTVVVSPDNQTLYVGTDALIYFVDASSGTILGSVPAATAIHLALHPSQPLLYASMNAAGTVVEINTATRQVSRTFAVGGAPQAVAVSPAGDHLYIANEAGWLQIWDLTAGVASDSIALLGGGFGIGVTQDVVVVAESFGGHIEVFDRATGIRRSLLSPGGTPRRVATNNAGTVAAVANEGGWVDFIE
jgi:DNA-binding beta-propeller fold protein YncE